MMAQEDYWTSKYIYFETRKTFLKLVTKLEAKVKD